MTAHGGGRRMLGRFSRITGAIGTLAMLLTGVAWEAMAEPAAPAAGEKPTAKPERPADQATKAAATTIAHLRLAGGLAEGRPRGACSETSRPGWASSSSGWTRLRRTLASGVCCL